MESEIRMGVRIPMRDGVRLSSCLWLPRDRAEPLATCLMATCYMSSRPHARARQFNNSGWAFLGVDCRGRSDSEGVYNPSCPVSIDDAEDIFNWIRAQPWSNGEVATRGGSALGGIQWQILRAHPDGLIAAAPSSAAKPGYDSTMLNNIVSLSHLQWLVLVHGRIENHPIYDDEFGFWTEFFRRAYREHWSLLQMAEAFGPDAGFTADFEQILAHPAIDGHWDALDIGPADYAAIDVPILSVAGYWDGNQNGTLLRYFEHMTHGVEKARTEHYLVLGPWDHAGAGLEKHDAYGVTFPANAYVPRFPLHLGFFEWACGRGERPAFLEDRVGWYVTGADEWRWAPNYEAIAPTSRTLYLASDGRANAFHRAGSLETASATPGAEFDVFQCNPFDLRCGLAELSDYPEQLIDPAYIRLYGNDGVVYLSAPLEADMEIAGIPRVVLWLEADAPDFDLALMLHEVLPDGRIFYLTETRWRARWRRSLREQHLMPLAQAEECVIDRFYFFARRLGKGSRLRIVIRALSSIVHQRNYNSAKPVGEQRAEDGCVATVKVLHDAEHPSRVELPISA